MDDYSAAHKELNIPDNLPVDNPADIQRSAPGGRGVASKRRRLQRKGGVVSVTLSTALGSIP
jgi:hypothetical protein